MARSNSWQQHLWVPYEPETFKHGPIYWTSDCQYEDQGPDPQNDYKDGKEEAQYKVLFSSLFSNFCFFPNNVLDNLTLQASKSYLNIIIVEVKTAFWLI